MTEREKETIWQKRRRTVRRRMGFCWHCLEPALPGLTSCVKHSRQINEWSTRARKRRQKERGWRLVRVKI